MSIKHSIDELDQIKAEISRNNAINRNLRQRARDLEGHIADYLQNKSQAGVKYKGRTIILETKERRLTKNKSAKERDVVTLLKQLGVDNPRDAYVQLLNAQRGDSVEQQKLMIKKIKKK